MSLLGYCKIVQSVAPVTSNTGLTETEIDCTGFDRVCHIINVGAMTVGGTFDYKVQEDSATGMASAADVTGAKLTQVKAASGASKVYAIDIPVNPAKPFQQAVAACGTANVTVGAIAILYKGSGTYPKTAATEAIIL
jgi:hypothetical protein